jgi:hypothetical protein
MPPPYQVSKWADENDSGRIPSLAARGDQGGLLVRYTEIARNIIEDGIRIVQVCNLPLNVSEIMGHIGFDRQKFYGCQYLP